MELNTLLYEVDGRVARITLNRPERGNGITMDMPRELAHCVEQADINPEVHVIALAGNGSGFCGGYDLVASAEQGLEAGEYAGDSAEGTVLSSAVQGRNHDHRDMWVFLFGCLEDLQAGHVTEPDIAQQEIVTIHVDL